MGPYQDTFRRSIADPDEFWGEAAKLIDWSDEQGPATIDDPAALDPLRPFLRASG